MSDDDVLADFAAGMPVDRIRSKYRIGYTRLYAIVDRAGLSRRRRTIMEAPLPQPYATVLTTPRQRCIAYALQHRPDWTLSQIAAHCRVSIAYVSRIRSHLATGGSCSDGKTV